jgi:anti-sigma factor RsiW
MTGITDVVEPGMTIRCQELVELITDYLDGALDTSSRVELEAHLRLCPGCWEYLSQIEATRTVLGLVPLDNLPQATRIGLVDAFRSFNRR